MLETYQKLSARYYHYDMPVAPADELAFYLHYARAVQGKILEPMCGTGNFLIPLLKEGLDTEGFDASEHMLQVLQSRCAQEQITPRVWHSFLEDLERPEQYDLIFIPSGSFGLITDPVAVHDSLQVMYQHLNPGGLLVLEAETSYALPDVLESWYQNVAYGPQGERIVRSTFPQPPCDGVATVLCRFERIERDQVVELETEEFKLRLYSQQEMIELLTSIGFTVHAVKAYDVAQQPAADDATVVYECIKK